MGSQELPGELSSGSRTAMPGCGNAASGPGQGERGHVTRHVTCGKVCKWNVVTP